MAPTYRRCDYRSASSPLLKEQSSNLASVSPPKPACYSENVRACARMCVGGESKWGSVGAGDEGKGGREKKKEEEERWGVWGGGGVALSFF